MNLEEINEAIAKCRNCRLWKESRFAVPGEGPADARIMLVGQNPGAKEGETGKPFVGRSGKYLDSVLRKYNINREKLFITSIVKHKSPRNRQPTRDEISACLPHLVNQINSIKPEVIILMGKVALHAPRFGGIKYLETYHPTAAMRFPAIREKFEHDMEEAGKSLLNDEVL